jgi:hypothetical protein
MLIFATVAVSTESARPASAQKIARLARIEVRKIRDFTESSSLFENGFA